MNKQNISKNTLNQHFGLSMRTQHLPHIFEQRPDIGWFEVISENFMDTDGLPKTNLARMKELYPIAIHGVSLSIGSIDPLRSEYLQKLKKLIQWLKPMHVSDHLCWTGVAHKTTHDLLPVPYTEEALKHIIQKIKQVQDYLEMPIAFENPSTYLEFKQSSMPEAEFITRMVEGSNCNLLLDVNNVFVTCFNHGLDVQRYIDVLPLEKVTQIHLAGHSHQGNHIIDTHDNYVADDVWAIYDYVLKKLNSNKIINTMIEWDDNIPSFEILHAEVNKAKNIAEKITEKFIENNINKNNEKNIKNTKNVDDLQNVQNLEGVEDLQDLLKTQNVLQENIFNKKNKNNKNDKNNNKAAIDLIKPKKNFSAKQQLQVYQNAYKYRLYEVVAMDYPILKNYLGDAAFSELIFDFIALNPPEHFNIARFSCKLPAFLQQQKSYIDDVFAHELCDFETHLAQIADQAESPPLSFEDIANLDETAFMQLKLKSREAFKLLAYQHNINQYYIEQQANINSTNIEKTPSYIIVFRDDDTVWRMDCDFKEYTLLQLLLTKNQTIEEAINNINNINNIEENNINKSNIELSAEDIFNYFSKWMQHKILRKS